MGDYHKPVSILRIPDEPSRVLGEPWSHRINGLGTGAVILLVVQSVLAYAAMRTSAAEVRAYLANDTALSGAIGQQFTVIRWAQLFAGVLCAVYFVRWVHQVRASERCNRSGFTYRPALAACGWFLPYVVAFLGPLFFGGWCWPLVLGAALMGPATLGDLWTGVRSAALRARGVASLSTPLPSTAFALWTVGWLGMHLAPLVDVFGWTRAATRDAALQAAHDQLALQSALTIGAALALAVFIVGCRAVADR